MKKMNVTMIVCFYAGFLLAVTPVWAAEKDKGDTAKGKTGKSSTSASAPAAKPAKSATTIKPTTVKSTKPTTTVKPTKPTTTVKPTKPTPPKDKFTQEKGYEDKHKSRVTQIDKKYDSDIAKKRQEIKDLQQATSASGKGVRDDAKKKTDKLNQDIDKMNRDKKQKIDDSRDTMKRQKDAVWK